jgi:hypothetical protein
MTANSGTQSVGLQGAKAIGDARVSSLLQFSWADRHDTKVTASAAVAVREESSRPNGEPALPAERPRQAGASEG